VSLEPAAQLLTQRQLGGQALDAPRRITQRSDRTATTEPGGAGGPPRRAGGGAGGATASLPLVSPPTSHTALRTLAFGDAQGQLWGTGWFARADGSGVMVIANGGDARVLQAGLEAADAADGRWSVRGQGVELAVEPAGAAVAMSVRDGAVSGFEQLCTVAGPALGAGGAPVRGRRGECVPASAIERYDSVREVSAWFGDDEATALIALRPRKRRGHEDDEVGAAVVVGDGWGPVVDPRLSTTYSAGGEPTRMGIELWAEDPEQLPRRLAGESLRRAAHATVAGWELHAELMRCHSNGRDGTGVYVLARPA
jgi:hypothetical protein